jgi:glutathione-regulated potassium-efflux system ancillary protein KefC
MMQDALIFLCAAVICVPVAKRLGLGSVLGYLVAGAVLGRSGHETPDEVESIKDFSEFGVVLMLFLIGLELDPKRLWSMRREVFGGGILQFLLCGVVLGVAVHYLGLGWKAGLLAGFALAMSSTAIAVQTMTERNFLITPTGRSSFAILLFQDVAAVPMLAAIPLLAGSGTGDTPVWMEALKAFAAIAGVIVIGRYLTRPALRLIAGTGLRELFTAFSLLLVIGIAQLMVLADLPMAIGAFLAGVLLANSEYRHALESDIEPFKGLLLGLFFISVGMSVDFSLLVSEPGKVALVLAAFLLLKIVALWVIAWTIGVSGRQRWLFAMLLSQGGEFGFVVFGAAGTAGVLPPEWAALLTMVVALSMAATPLLLLVHDKVMASKVIAGEGEADVIDEPGGPVIIAGFGRFGQIIGRLLFANGIRAIVLDHDPDQIEMLRKFGYKVFYGDATRLDLMQAAGARDANLLVIAIDDVEDSLLLADLAILHFPHLKIVARARNVSHYIELKNRGIRVVERETFESALKLGRHVLESLGVDPYRAIEIANAFRRHNIGTMDALIPHFRDELKVLSSAKAGREELERQFAQDRAKFEDENEESWV